jgi:hypothetical protein
MPAACRIQHFMAARTCTRRAAGRWLTGALLTTLVLGWAAPSAARGQQPPKSLGEIAREEAERRKALKPAKVYTKDDLPRSAMLPPAAAGAGGAAAAAGDAQDPPTAKPEAGEKPGAEKPEGEKDEAWWRNRMTQAREAVRRNEMFVTALQSRLNALTADFAARDDPFQRAQITDERNKTLAELEQVSKEIKDLQAEIAQIETEAQQAGIPPGWIR